MIRGAKTNAVEIVPPRSHSPQKARDEVANQFSTNSRYIQDAKTLRDAAPGLLEQVKRGECQRVIRLIEGRMLDWQI